MKMVRLDSGGKGFSMAGSDKLKQDIREIVHEVVDPRFDKMDVQFASINSQFASVNSQFASVNSQLRTILDRLPPAPPSGPGSADQSPKP